MVRVSRQGCVASETDYACCYAQASGEAFDLKSVFFRSAQLSPCLKVIDVKVDWSDGA